MNARDPFHPLRHPTLFSEAFWGGVHISWETKGFCQGKSASVGGKERSLLRGPRTQVLPESSNPEQGSTPLESFKAEANKQAGFQKPNCSGSGGGRSFEEQRFWHPKNCLALDFGDLKKSASILPNPLHFALPSSCDHLSVYPAFFFVLCCSKGLISCFHHPFSLVSLTVTPTLSSWGTQGRVGGMQVAKGRTRL